MPNPDSNSKIALCEGCNTMKHLNAERLCGRCVNTQLHKRLTEISSSYSGYIGIRKSDMWVEMFEALEDYFSQALAKAEVEARLDERMLVDFEVEKECIATQEAKAFVTPEGLDGYKCCVRDVHLNGGDRRKVLEAQLTNPNPKEGK